MNHLSGCVILKIGYLCMAQKAANKSVNSDPIKRCDEGAPLYGSGYAKRYTN
jgi:hypothetical protein